MAFTLPCLLLWQHIHIYICIYTFRYVKLSCFFSYFPYFFRLTKYGKGRWMVHPTALGRRAVGFYIAVHPWLASVGYVKVGFTSDLARRLEMVSFKTCFTPEWSYFAVFHLESERQALLLEQSVLHLFRHCRVPKRELIMAKASDVSDGARRICELLNLDVRVDTTPSFTDDDVVGDDMRDVRLTVNEELQRRAEDCKQRTVEKFINLLEDLRKTMGFPDVTYDSHDDKSRAKDNAADAVGDDVADDGGDLVCDFDMEEKLEGEIFALTLLRPYQREAVERCLDELNSRGSTICQMACRCGKTPVAFQLIQHYVKAKPNAAILYLVPGLALLRQTARKLYGYGMKDMPFLLIGSHPGSILLGDDRMCTMTTDAELIRNTIHSRTEGLVVISTYQSSHIVSDVTAFDLTVFDECHRVCGSEAETNFNSVLLKPRCGHRLFLTATPAYDTPLRMSNTQLFGDVAYRYYLREGIDAGYVNPFAVRIILGENMDNMNPYIYEAMRIVDKMIVYCRCVEHAEQLGRGLRCPIPDDLAPFDVLLAYSRMGSPAVGEVLREFTASKRCVLLNVRLFQEGIEIPDLNAVFFSAPRYSSRDIVQSICRPLNKMEGKPISYVFLPATIDTKVRETDPVNLDKFSTLVPFADALMDEDPLLFEYLIDPQKVVYDIDVVGIRSLKISSDRLRRFVLPAIRRGVRYSKRNRDRLHRAAKLPWKTAFGEMKRIVMECNRYPKTNDAWVIGMKSVSMALFYQYCRKGYRQYLRKEPSSLKMHQIRDLETLPHWKTYGLHGPYPWDECMDTLRNCLRSDGQVPPLDVHKGGYIGLDATPFERLCGALMNVNQSDGHSHLSLDPKKQMDLDNICRQHGLKWRKNRDSSGKVIPGEVTFITDSYERFKELYQEHKEKGSFQKYLDTHFPGYPLKHERMEDPQNLKRDCVPPRHVIHNEGNPRTAEKVMCRVCRRHVPARLWGRHKKSKSHLDKMK
uniref:Probable helicase A859L n=1 Tax=Trypanosoma congolense (strain IL3000) TaxID=1068625 RepID=G0UY07_TRYCI|nr:putative helicase-like protein [Trypanosoma congolense IL3000]